MAATDDTSEPGPHSRRIPTEDPRLSIELLMSQLVEQASLIMTAQHRLRRLLIANRSIVQELALPAVLRRIVNTAKDLSDAKYAALGVIGADGLLEQFVHAGMDDETVREIGELPKGRGVLGALIDDPRPIRLARIADDHRSSGFPGRPSPDDELPRRTDPQPRRGLRQPVPGRPRPMASLLLPKTRSLVLASGRDGWHCDRERTTLRGVASTARVAEGLRRDQSPVA